MSALFDSGRQAFLEGTIAFLSDTIKACLMDHAIDNPNVATDNAMDDIIGGAYGTSGSQLRANMPVLGSKDTTAGVADAADTVFATVSAGPVLSSVVLFKDGASDALSPLIAKIDLSVTPNGGDITVSWDNTAGLKIFKL